MPRKRPSKPPLRLHKGSHQAYVPLPGGRRKYLGKCQSLDEPAIQEKYDRTVAELKANGGVLTEPPAALTVAQLADWYWTWADQEYRRDGSPTSEWHCHKSAVADLKRLYASTPAADFGPKRLKAVRQSMVGRTRRGILWTRGFINRQTRVIVGVFKWGVEEEIIPADVLHALQEVKGLRRGKTAARETAPITTVDDADIAAIEPHVSRQVWALIQFQRLTGARPGEAVRLRGADIDMSGPVWEFRLTEHKTAYRGMSRVVCIGPKAQEIIRPFLRADPNAYMFQPIEAEGDRAAARRDARESPVTPSQRMRAVAAARRKRGRPPGSHYTTASYRRAITRACDAAGIERWAPNQLRHSAATQIRKEHGLEAAQVCLGHSNASITEIYAESDLSKAREVAAKIG